MPPATVSLQLLNCSIAQLLIGSIAALLSSETISVAIQMPSAVCLTLLYIPYLTDIADSSSTYVVARCCLIII